MELKPLGKSDAMVPEIGLGTWQYNGDPELMSKVMEMGGFLIDTAEQYQTEEMIGQAVRGKRDGFFLATKVSPAHLHYRDVIKAADASLKRLETSYIDLYQVHWPNPSIPMEETMRAMSDLVGAGKVRHIGVSNFSVQQMEEAQQALSGYPIVSNQVRYNIFNRDIEDELLPYCAVHQVTIIAYSPLAQGRLDDQLDTRPQLRELLNTIGPEMGKTSAQVLLAWCVRHPAVITIPQTNRVHRVEENCGASGWQLTPEQYTALTEAAGPSVSVRYG